MIKAYLTKACLMDVICGGIDRCDVWLLHPPEFKPLTLECPMFGEITDPNELEIGHWWGQNHLKGKILRKAGGEPLDYAWAQILNTYRESDDFSQMLDNHNKASDAFYCEHRYPQPQQATDKHAFYVNEDARQRFIHHHTEKAGMRQHEWILPFTLNLTLG